MSATQVDHPLPLEALRKHAGKKAKSLMEADMIT